MMEITAGSPARVHSRALSGRKRVALVVLALLVAGWGGWWGFKHLAWWTPAGHDIARAVRGAISANETLLTPPQAYRNVPITAAEMARLSRRAQRTLADYYTGDPLSKWQAVAIDVLNPKDLHRGKTDAWMTNWRVDWIHLNELTLLPGHVTATASAEVRSNGGAINRLDYTFGLVQTRAGWRIDRETSAFELGYEP
jgi:hypothetical protein